MPQARADWGASAPRRWAAGLLGVATLLLVAWWWAGPHPAPDAVDYRPGRDGAFVQSHEGTAVDGDLRLWGGGTARLSDVATGLPYAELRRMFDYFLSAWGEQDLPAITARIHQELAQQLTGKAVDDARALLGKYLDYKRALVEIDSKPQYAGQGVGAIRERFAAVQALRQRIFDPREDEGLFGFDDAYDRDALARLEIHQDGQLSSAQKQQRLATLDAASPRAVREARDAPRQVTAVEEQVAQLRAQGRGELEVHALRAKAFGQDGALRLAALDREEQAWAQRIQEYRAERQHVMAQWSDPAQQNAALARLQQSRFTAEEIPRLAAYEPQ